MVARMLLVYGPRSATYDFGPGHPLTPRRFGPGIDLLRAVGAIPGLEPEPAPDDELAWCHLEAYIEVVKRFSTAPYGPPKAGIAVGGDDPPFPGMHDAAAIARARRDGLRVLYVDLDVHHGDGVQAIHWDDPGVMTVSVHESGLTLFPGTGFADETGEGIAAGTSVNVPLAAASGERVWLETLRTLLPELVAT